MTEEDFGDLYTSLKSAIFAFAARRVGPESAKDVLSDTFEVAWSKRHEFPADRSAWAAWVVGIAKNKVLQELQRHRRKHHDSRFVADWVSPTHEPASEDASRIVVEQDIGRRVYGDLSPAEQLLFDIAFIRELSPEGAAAVLGISLTAYTTRVSRLRQRLRLLQQQANDTANDLIDSKEIS